MILAKVTNGFVVDTIVADVVIDGWQKCPEWVGIGMAINALPPSGWKSSKQIKDEDEATLSAIKGDTLVQSFIAMTPAQVNSYIDTQVTDLASAKTVLKFFGRMVLILARREYR